jgi:hypothetical protein
MDSCRVRQSRLKPPISDHKVGYVLELKFCRFGGAAPAGRGSFGEICVDPRKSHQNSITVSCWAIGDSQKYKTSVLENTDSNRGQQNRPDMGIFGHPRTRPIGNATDPPATVLESPIGPTLMSAQRKPTTGNVSVIGRLILLSERITRELS